jgi:hypothetical protein
LQVTAYDSVNPLDRDGVGCGGGGMRPSGDGSDGEGDAAGGALGVATVEGTGVQPASTPAATTNETTRGHLIGTC